MAITFLCGHCERPLEVDDEAAGQFADCPFCHRVVPVPVRSQAVAAAMPMGGSAQVGGYFPPVAQQTELEHPSALYGWLAVVSLVISVVSFFITCFMILSVIDLTGPIPDVKALEDQMMTLAQKGGFQFAYAGFIGGGLSAVFAAMISLFRKERPIWPAATAIVCAVLGLLAMVAMTALSAMMY